MVGEVPGKDAEDAGDGLFAEPGILDFLRELGILHLRDDFDECRLASLRLCDAGCEIGERRTRERRGRHTNRVGDPGSEERAGAGDVFSDLASAPGGLAVG